MRTGNGGRSERGMKSARRERLGARGVRWWRLTDPRIGDELAVLAPVVVRDRLLEPGVGKVGVVADDDLHGGGELLDDVMDELEEALDGGPVLLPFRHARALLDLGRVVRLR